MSEDIKDIIEILELSKEEIENNDENITATLDLQDLKALKNLYDLYNKEKEKNKELEEENTKFYNGELYTAKQLKNYEKTIKTYWINKKIIMNKIIEYEKKAFNKKTNQEKLKWSDFDLYLFQRDVLQELLEERN